MKTFLAALLCSLTLIGYCPPAEAAISDAVLVWIDQNSPGTYKIHLQSMEKGSWGEAVILSSSDQGLSRPTVIRDSNDDIWVAWTLFKEGGRTIHYRYYSAAENRWQPEQELETATQTNLAPDLAIDQDNTIWLTYAGSGPGLSDIYLTSWNGEGWNRPVRVNAEDQSPDVSPRFAYNSEAGLTLLWKGFEKGGYTLYRSTSENSGWSEEELAGEKERKRVKNKRQQRLKEYQDLLPPLPRILQPANQGFLYFSTDRHPQSCRLGT